MSALTDIMDELPPGPTKESRRKFQGTDSRRVVASGPAQGLKANASRVCGYGLLN